MILYIYTIDVHDVVTEKVNPIILTQTTVSIFFDTLYPADFSVDARGLDVQDLVLRCPTLKGINRGLYVCSIDAILAGLIIDDYLFYKLRSELINTKGTSTGLIVYLNPLNVTDLISQNLDST